MKSVNRDTKHIQLVKQKKCLVRDIVIVSKLKTLNHFQKIKFILNESCKNSFVGAL